MKKPNTSGNEPPLHFASCEDAENTLCVAIAALGRVAGIDPDLGEGPDDIDASLIQAAYESNFGDPDFIGGSGCFGRAVATGNVAALTSQVSIVTRGLVRYILKKSDQDARDVAEACVDEIDGTLAWLANQPARA